MEKIIDVSIIVPFRNEESHIKKCAQSILLFKNPDRLQIEIFFVDGMSEDNTCKVLKKIIKYKKNIEIIKNKKLTQSAGLNLALTKARGKYVMRLDAHTYYPKGYLRDCYRYAISTMADNVGGTLITKCNGTSLGAKIVQAITTHRFGVGNSGFRTRSKKKIVDTVPYGFFRRDIFNKIGLFDQRLIRGQDYEFNKRITKSGGLIASSKKVNATYYNQKSFVSFIKKQIMWEAPYNSYMWYLAPYSFTPRHAVTGCFVVGIISGVTLSPIFPIQIGRPFFFVMVLYAILGITSSLQQAIRYKEIIHVFALPPAFFLFHFFHGLGILTGFLKLLFLSAPVQKTSEPWDRAGFFRVPIFAGILKKEAS